MTFYFWVLWASEKQSATGSPGWKSWMLGLRPVTAVFFFPPRRRRWSLAPLFFFLSASEAALESCAGASGPPVLAVDGAGL